MRSASVGRTFLLVLATAFFVSLAHGQTFSLFPGDAFAREGVGSLHLGVDMARFGAPQSFRLEASLLPKQIRPLNPGASGNTGSLGKPFFGVTAVRPANAHANRASCAAPCRPLLPFQEPPIDAAGILARCNRAGLWGLVVGNLHALSLRANQPR